MPVEIDIAHVARLARLDLSDEALEMYRDQLGVILDHAARVQALGGDPEILPAHNLGVESVYREDVARESLDRDEVFVSAPDTREGYFVVPPALETE